MSMAPLKKSGLPGFQRPAQQRPDSRESSPGKLNASTQSEFRF